MGKLTYQEALDKAVDKILENTEPLRLPQLLWLLDVFNEGFTKDDYKYIRAKIIEKKSKKDQKLQDRVG